MSDKQDWPSLESTVLTFSKYFPGFFRVDFIKNKQKIKLLLTQMHQIKFLHRTTIMVLARFKAFFVDGQNHFSPFLRCFLLQAKRIMPVFGVIFVTGKTHYAHLHLRF